MMPRQHRHSASRMRRPQRAPTHPPHAEYLEMHPSVFQRNLPRVWSAPEDHPGQCEPGRSPLSTTHPTRVGGDCDLDMLVEVRVCACVCACVCVPALHHTPYDGHRTRMAYGVSYIVYRMDRMAYDATLVRAPQSGCVRVCEREHRERPKRGQRGGKEHACTRVRARVPATVAPHPAQAHRRHRAPGRPLDRLARRRAGGLFDGWVVGRRLDEPDSRPMPACPRRGRTPYLHPH
jgi:hypothetical protein